MFLVAALAVGGCGQSVHDPGARAEVAPRAATKRPVVAVRPVVSPVDRQELRHQGRVVNGPRVEAVVVRQRAADRSAAGLKRAAVRLVRSLDANHRRRHRLGVVAQRKALVEAKKLADVAGASQVTACVRRSRGGLLRSLHGRVPSARQVAGVVDRCLSQPRRVSSVAGARKR